MLEGFGANTFLISSDVLELRDSTETKILFHFGSRSAALQISNLLENDGINVSEPISTSELGITIIIGEKSWNP